MLHQIQHIIFHWKHAEDRLSLTSSKITLGEITKTNHEDGPWLIEMLVPVKQPSKKYLQYLCEGEYRSYITHDINTAYMILEDLSIGFIQDILGLSQLDYAVDNIPDAPKKTRSEVENDNLNTETTGYTSQELNEFTRERVEQLAFLKAWYKMFLHEKNNALKQGKTLISTIDEICTKDIGDYLKDRLKQELIEFILDFNDNTYGVIRLWLNRIIKRNIYDLKDNIDTTDILENSRSNFIILVKLNVTRKIIEPHLKYSSALGYVLVTPISKLDEIVDTYIDNLSTSKLQDISDSITYHTLGTNIFFGELFNMISKWIASNSHDGT